MVDLNTRLPSGSGWNLQNASGINGLGWITGTGIIGGYSHAFLMSPDLGPVPTPEPSTLLLLGSGFAGLGFMALKRKAKIS